MITPTKNIAMSVIGVFAGLAATLQPLHRLNANISMFVGCTTGHVIATIAPDENKAFCAGFYSFLGTYLSYQALRYII